MTEEEKLYERLEELECQLSSMVSARDMTIRDLRATMKEERALTRSLLDAVGQFYNAPDEDSRKAVIAAWRKCNARIPVIYK